VAMEDCEVAIRTKSAIISKVVIIPKVVSGSNLGLVNTYIRDAK